MKITANETATKLIYFFFASRKERKNSLWFNNNQLHKCNIIEAFPFSVQHSNCDPIFRRMAESMIDKNDIYDSWIKTADQEMLRITPISHRFTFKWI